jgi:hypothetical protein
MHITGQCQLSHASVYYRETRLSLLPTTKGFCITSPGYRIIVAPECVPEHMRKVPTDLVIEITPIKLPNERVLVS